MGDDIRNELGLETIVEDRNRVISDAYKASTQQWTSLVEGNLARMKASQTTFQMETQRTGHGTKLCEEIK